MSSFERYAKRRLIGLVGPLYPARRPSGEIGRILLVRVDDRLGNLILLSPTIDWLRQALPRGEIGLVMTRTFASIYEHDPRITRLHIIDKAKQKAFFPNFFRDLSRVAAVRYDAVLECSDRSAFSFNNALYARVSRAARRIGFATDLAHQYLTDPVSPPADRHAARDPLALAAALVKQEPPPLEECRLSLHLPQPDAGWKDRLDSMSGVGSGSIIGVHVGGRGRKRWPIACYLDLARGLLAAGHTVWIFRGPMETDVDEILRRDGPDGLVLVPRADIVRIGQAMARCRLVIAPDTGPMHLASAVGSRTLAFFLHSDAERYRPFAPEDHWIDARGEELSPARVLETALTMLRPAQAAEVK